jgi:hypothetical protein
MRPGGVRRLATCWLAARRAGRSGTGQAQGGFSSYRESLCRSCARRLVKVVLCPPEPLVLDQYWRIHLVRSWTQGTPRPRLPNGVQSSSAPMAAACRALIDTARRCTDEPGHGACPVGVLRARLTRQPALAAELITVLLAEVQPDQARDGRALTGERQRTAASLGDHNITDLRGDRGGNPGRRDQELANARNSNSSNGTGSNCVSQVGDRPADRRRRTHGEDRD